MNGTLVTVDGRPALRFERHLKHPVERVWRAIIVPAELASWFPAAADWTPEAGEVFEAGGQTGQVTALEPPHLIEWTFAGQAFRFDLSAEPDGCALVFTHVFDDGVPAARTAAGWECYFDRLEPHLAGEDLSEEAAHDPIGERHEYYAARFGLDPAPGREFIANLAFRGLTLADGPVLRLERRYGQPVERVWRALTDPEELRHWFPGALDVSHSDPPRLLVGSWNGGTLRFELRARAEGCLLVFTHTFGDRDQAALTAAGWDRCYARFDAVLAGQPMDEAVSLDLWPRVHERYAAAWGIDPAIGRQVFAEHSSA
ncbi:MAG TPA: SRPBCC domain-containing protein [Pseudonocardiaceae bacterium]|nr:SRPBCC domain-containing protein [Pseudonocardiaceae bacterium]